MAMFLSKALAGKPLLPPWITSKSVDLPSKRCANGERWSSSNLVGVTVTISVSEGFSCYFVSSKLPNFPDETFIRVPSDNCVLLLQHT